VTTFQMIALSVLALVCLTVYGPMLLPKIQMQKKPDLMGQIQAVVTIRDAAVNPKVKSACSELLSALLQ
jgi:hypothetical protein